LVNSCPKPYPTMSRNRASDKSASTSQHFSGSFYGHHCLETMSNHKNVEAHMRSATFAAQACRKEDQMSSCIGVSKNGIQAVACESEHATIRDKEHSSVRTCKGMQLDSNKDLRHTIGIEDVDFVESLFQKTKLCKFYNNICKKGSSCRFAHDEAERRRIPNLWNSNLCPKLIAGSNCDNPNCHYAHGLEELHIVEPSSSAVLGPGTHVDFSTAMSAKADVDHKNTFSALMAPGISNDAVRAAAHRSNCLRELPQSCTKPWVCEGIPVELLIKSTFLTLTCMTTPVKRSSSVPAMAEHSSDRFPDGFRE